MKGKKNGMPGGRKSGIRARRVRSLVSCIPRAKRTDDAIDFFLPGMRGELANEAFAG